MCARTLSPTRLHTDSGRPRPSLRPSFCPFPGPNTLRHPLVPTNSVAPHPLYTYLAPTLPYTLAPAAPSIPPSICSSPCPLPDTCMHTLYLARLYTDSGRLLPSVHPFILSPSPTHGTGFLFAADISNT
eukprot:253159-Chlamydomonas_euryale.AAC.1